MVKYSFDVGLSVVLMRSTYEWSASADGYWLCLRDLSLAVVSAFLSFLFFEFIRCYLMMVKYLLRR